MTKDSEHPQTNVPVLEWDSKVNAIKGKLKLKSMERSHLFFEQWVHYIQIDAGIPELTKGNGQNPLSLNKNVMPKKVNVPSDTMVIQGIFELLPNTSEKGQSSLGAKLKIMVWVETDEESDGVEFDFQKE